MDAPDPDYWIEASGDAIYVHGKNDERMQIIVGEGAQLSTSEQDAALSTNGAVTPAENRRGEFVATRSGVNMRVTLSGVSEIDRERLLAGVRFCGNEPQ